ncbi:hypothetical protein BDL97_17G018800 [Sphagnum fallax]|nr:hypothetical protein BDL97_17G018800 [Sphagnum fallax]
MGEFVKRFRLALVFVAAAPPATARLLLLLLQLLFLLSSSCCATQEGDAIASMLQSLHYTKYNGTDPCTWDPAKIVCDPISGRITELHFHAQRLTGPLPAEIGVFTAATWIDLSYNSFSSLPDDLANLVNLQKLNLSASIINASFPLVVLKLTNLTDLRLENSFLTGVIPPEISLLTKMEYLYLGNNSFTGPIPSSLGEMSNLRNLSLWSNIFVGFTIPPELGNLSMLSYLNLHSSFLWGGLPQELAALNNLTILWLYSNYFSGFIPAAWKNMIAMHDLRIHSNHLSGVFPVWLPSLPNLTNLEVDSNEFSGTIPAFTQSPSLLEAYNRTNKTTFNLACNYFSSSNMSAFPSYINVSGNCLSARITSETCPSNYNCRIYPSLFQNGCAPCPAGYFLQDPKTCICAYGGSSSGKKFPYGAVVGGILGLCILILIVVALIRYKPFHIFDPFHKKEDYGDWQIPNDVKKYAFLELAKATDNFSAAHEIGAGGFGKVFCGTFDDGKMVAIKRARGESMQGMKEFRNEVLLLSRLHHRHLVRLEGFCDDKGLQILVYEFMKNGNLHDFLLDGNGSKLLSWGKRLEIAVGIAQGLDYLHSYADPPVIHRDVKPSNILLDENLIAKVSDFGISKENEDSFTHISTRPAGTAGYLDPEYFLRRQLTTASDVYGYGVLLLEIITGQQAIDHMRVEEMNLIRWVKPRFKKEGVERIVDPKLGNDYNKETMSVMTEVALMCAASSKNDRPSMKEVLTLLEPHLIARKPVAHSELLPSGIQSNNEKLEAKLYEGVTSEAMWANTTNLQQTKFSGSNTGSSTTSDITEIDPR